jgi:hypothetical protein
MELSSDALRRLLAASRGFLRYVLEYSDPVEDEPRYVEFRRAMRSAAAVRKSKPTPPEASEK